MGWDYTHRSPGLTDLDYWKSRYGKWADGTEKVIAVATVGWGETYMAYRYENGTVGAVVILIKRTKGDFNFGSKSMTELMGPYYTNCPKRILDLLDPVETVCTYQTGIESATRWRTACLETIANRTKHKLAKGKVVIFKRDLNYGTTRTRAMLVIETGRKARFVPAGNVPDGWLVYRVSRYSMEDIEAVVTLDEWLAQYPEQVEQALGWHREYQETDTASLLAQYKVAVSKALGI